MMVMKARLVANVTRNEHLVVLSVNQRASVETVAQIRSRSTSFVLVITWSHMRSIVELIVSQKSYMKTSTRWISIRKVIQKSKNWTNRYLLTKSLRLRIPSLNQSSKSRIRVWSKFVILCTTFTFRLRSKGSMVRQTRSRNKRVVMKTCS